MKATTGFLVAVLAAVGTIWLTPCSCRASSAAPLSEEDAAKANQTRAICKRSMMLLAKRVVKHLRPCDKDLKAKYPNKDDYLNHFQCKVKCVMNKLAVVDDEYKLSNATVDKFLEQNMPPEAHDYLWGITGHCHHEWGPKLGPQTGDLCLEYGEYFKCLQGTLGNCDPEKLKEEELA